MRNYVKPSFEFSPGSTIAYIVMDFDTPLSLAEQSQITYAVQEGVANAGSEVSEDGISSISFHAL